MSVITKDLGIATAYGYAKSKGYTGTEEEFAELMASYADVAQQAEAAAQDAEDAKDEAVTAKTDAQTAKTAAQTAQSAAETASGTASAKASEAAQSAQSAAGSASAAQISATAASGSAQTAQAAAQTATTKASEASSSASAASTAKTGAETARTGAQTAQTAAETAQANAEAAASSVSASAAQIEQNTEEIGAIKNDLSEKADKTDALSAYIVETETGNIASFSDGADDVPVKDLTVAIEPVQSGSGDPSPENIRPISGWTGANVTRTGKNLYDVSKQVIANSNTNTFLIVNLKHNTDYVFSTNKQIGGLYINYSDNETCPDVTGFWRELDHAYSVTSLAFNSGSHKWYKLTTYEGSIQDRTYQLEFGSTASAYEPFVDSDTVSVDWTTEAGTVYGGTLDVTTGVLTVDKVLLTKNTSTMDNEEIFPGWKNAGISALIGEDLDVLRSNQLLNIGKIYGANTKSTRDILYLPKSIYNKTQTEWIAVAMDIQIVVELATPQTFQLTPQEVSTVLGQNNIFADTGNVTVQYRADTKLYIDKVLNA